MNKLNLGIMFGGKSAEHEISLISGKNVISSLDMTKYEIIRIGITKSGQFYYFDNDNYLINSDDPNTIALDISKGQPITFAFGEKMLVGLKDNNLKIKLDVVFPVLHGTNGEDGTMQGLLKILDVAFVGPGVLGSAVGMDKIIAKHLLQDAGVPISKSLSFDLSNKAEINFEKVESVLKLPMFIKPANSGSSVGINKAHNKEEFAEFIEEAFKYDSKIVVEEGIVGREIEVSVLGNEEVKASLPGEVIPSHEFYDYDAKYLDENGAAFKIPVELSPEQTALVQETAVKTFKALSCEGMARVDGFLTEEGKFILNEINTIPGFTKISMYPKLWEVSGISYPQLLDKLIELALKRHAREKIIEENYDK
jgi:D-alanine-D-alanine ligase